MDRVFENGFALLIGVSEYSDPLVKEFAFPILDIFLLAEFFTDSTKMGYEKTHVHVLRGHGATLDNIRKELLWLSQVGDKNSTIVVYFAGMSIRGITGENGELHLCPYDYSSKNGKDTSISENELVDYLGKIVSDNVLIYFDIVPFLNRLPSGIPDLLIRYPGPDIMKFTKNNVRKAVVVTTVSVPIRGTSILFIIDHYYRSQHEVVGANQNSHFVSINEFFDSLKLDILFSQLPISSCDANNDNQNFPIGLRPLPIKNTMDDSCPIQPIDSPRHSYPSLPMLTPRSHIDSTENNPKSQEAKNKDSGVSVSFPRIFCKGHSTKLLVTIFPKNLQKKAKKEIAASMDGYDNVRTRTFMTEALAVEDEVVMRLSSPSLRIIDSERHTKITDQIMNMTFLCTPEENARTGKHEVLLTINDAKTGYEILSQSCQIYIEDYVVDHMPRSIITALSSIVCFLASLITYTLTLLQELDKTFGLTAGTAALFGMGMFLYLYDHNFRRLTRTEHLS